MENQTTNATALSVFNYKGNNVTFRDVEGTLMVNATEMAKAFGKTPKDWLRTGPSKEFIDKLSAVRHICPTDLVRVVQGGSPEGQGTWMHEDVAIEFSRWLSPEFAIWCNDRIKELLTKGYVELPATPNPIANPQVGTMEAKVRFVDLMSDRLRLNEASRLGLYQQIGDEYGLKLPSYVKSEGVLKSASVLLKEIGSSLSAIKFNDLLIRHGYLEELTRPSAKGGEKKFKSITAKGMEYGQNLMSPKNQKETQPQWLSSKFRELHDLVTA